MSYINRRATKRTAGSAELLYLLIVLAAGFSTAWWAGHKIGVDLSSINAMASILGITEGSGHIDRAVVGYDSNAAINQVSLTPLAPYCAPGETPTFVAGLANLDAQLGATMGTPVECGHATSGTSGDTIQQTSTGLAAYNTLTDTFSFTDGWRHWAITPRGLVQWEGTDSTPPAG